MQFSIPLSGRWGSRMLKWEKLSGSMERWERRHFVARKPCSREELSLPKPKLPELWSWELQNQRIAESPSSSRRAISHSSFKNKSNGCRRNKTPKDRQWLCALKQLSSGCFLAWSHCSCPAQPTQVPHTLCWAAFFTGGGFTCPFGELKCYLLHV